MNPDTAYQNAVTRRKQLISELEDVDRFLDLYRRFASEPSPRAVENVNPARVREHQITEGQSAPPARASISQEKFAKEARLILLENGYPMKRGDLVRAFKERGMEIGGTDEGKNLGTKIWRAGTKFINIEGKGYWPRDVACPEIDYVPRANFN